MQGDGLQSGFPFCYLDVEVDVSQVEGDAQASEPPALHSMDNVTARNLRKHRRKFAALPGCFEILHLLPGTDHKLADGFVTWLDHNSNPSTVLRHERRIH